MATVFLRLPLSLCTALTLLLCAAGPSTCGAAAADEWQAIVALDAGPQQQFRAAQEARAGAATHVARQEKVLRAFLAAYPQDPHALEARLRLARALQIRADLERSAPLRSEAKRLLDQIDPRSLSADQSASVGFAKVSLLMRSFRTPTPAQRDELLSAARAFQRDHPDDRRVAPLLAEVARAFDLLPRMKRALLLDAQALTTDAELKGAIADDLKRLDLLGQTVPLRFDSVQGQPFDLEQARGRVVVLTFFAEWSPPSMLTLLAVQKAVAGFPNDKVQPVGVSLDEDRQALADVLKEQAIAWPVAFDGKGWQSPLVRSLGINALPTVWLFDKQGRLRSLNAVESAAGQVQQLIDER